MTHSKTVLVLLLLSSPASADPKAKPAARAPAAKPAAPARAPTDAKLAQLIGRWEGTSEFKLRGKSSSWKVTTSCERAAISPAVLCSTVATSGDMQMEELWMFGFDDHTKTYHLFMTNNWGEAYDHASTWTDAASVSFVHSATRDGKPMTETYALTFKNDQMVCKGGLKVGDEVVGDGTTTVHRVQ